MSKIVLVLNDVPEMPTNCDECILEVYDNHHIKVCIATDLVCQYSGEFGMSKRIDRPDWCPLHELPNVETVKIDPCESTSDYYKWGWKDGWNRFRDRVLGIEEDE